VLGFPLLALDNVPPLSALRRHGRSKQRRSDDRAKRRPDQLSNDECRDMVEAIPANVVVKPRASVTAGLAKDVEAVNQ